MVSIGIEDFVQAVPTALICVGMDRRVVAANSSAEALFGKSLAGQPSTAILRHPEFLNGLETCIQEQRSLNTRVVLPGTAGETHLAVSFAPIESSEGPMVVIGIDDKSSLEQADAMRRDFVANVSHELRTPLTALVGFIETLKGPARDDPAARDRFLGIMGHEAGRMIRLVNDLLSLGRVEADERRRPTGQTDVISILRATLESHRDRAKSLGVELALETGRNALAIPGDADQLAQVFHNLIENAIKYGAAGGVVTVRVATLDREPTLRGPAVQIDVIDTGAGIEPIHLPRLTERFYRVDTGRSRASGGTGLGLAIVKHIVNRHRGRLRVESEVGKGSRFSVILPAR